MNKYLNNKNKTSIWDLFCLYFFLFFSGLFFFNSCTPDPPPTLNYKDRQVVDSLFRKEVDSLKPMLDSICDMRFDSAVQFTVDSIMKERQTDRDIYLERLKKKMEEKE